MCQRPPIPKVPTPPTSLLPNQLLARASVVPRAIQQLSPGRRGARATANLQAAADTAAAANAAAAAAETGRVVGMAPSILGLLGQGALNTTILGQNRRTNQAPAYSGDTLGGG